MNRLNVQAEKAIEITISRVDRDRPEQKQELVLHSVRKTFQPYQCVRLLAIKRSINN